jgi:predicted permease
VSGLNRALVWAVRLPLRLAPSSFRQDYAGAIERDLLSLLAAERRRIGWSAAVRLSLLAWVDVARAVVAEWRLIGGGGSRPGSDLSGDVRAAARAWRRSPVLAATLVGLIASGLSIASAIFAFADGYLTRPSPFPRADQIFIVETREGRPVRATEAEALRQSDLAYLGFVDGTHSSAVPWAGLALLDGREQRVFSNGVGEGFALLMGVPLVRGRHFTSDDHRGIEPVPIWLTHRFWLQQFGGRDDAIGARFAIRDGTNAANIVEVEVVGVTDPRVTTFDARFGRSNVLPDLFAPARPRVHDPDSRVIILASPYVRLPDDLSREQAEDRIGAALQVIAPAANAPRRVRLVSLHETQLAAGRPTARLLMLGALLVLALVTVNLLHLLLARSVARSAEVETRAALGASRWRIARLFLVESLTYGAAGVSLGVFGGWWLTGTIAATMPSRGSDAETLALVSMGFDGRVLLFACAMGLVMVVFGGAIPGWRAAHRSRPARSATAARAPLRWSKAMLASEIAVSTVVLAGVAFLGLGMWRYLTQPLGFATEDRFELRFESAGGRDAAVDWPAARARVRAIPGVRAATVGVVDELRERVRLDGEPLDDDDAVALGVAPGYFEARGVELRAGRFPTSDEQQTRASVAVVDEAMAARVWPGASPVGQMLTVGARRFEVVGLIANQRASLSRALPAMAFVPVAEPAERAALHVWTPGLSAGELARRVNAALAPVVPGHHATVIARTFDEAFDDDLAAVRLQRPILLTLGAFTLALAAIGLFGLASYLVERRLREFGIRIALGARPVRIVRDVVRHAAAPAVVGLALGLPAAWLLEGVARASMAGWESSGPLALTLVSAGMLVVVVLASVGPARRALAVDPTVTLRSE